MKGAPCHVIVTVKMERVIAIRVTVAVSQVIIGLQREITVTSAAMDAKMYVMVFPVTVNVKMVTIATSVISSAIRHV